MKLFIYITRAVFLLVVILVPYAAAAPALAANAPPTILSYQGRLTNSSGDLLGSSSGTTYYFKFSIWNNATVGSGSRVWPASAPTATTSIVRSGVFNVDIGDTANSYPDALNIDFSNYSALYLQVEVSSDNATYETLSPRQQITTAAYSALSGAVVGTTTQSALGTTTPYLSSAVTIAATTSSATPLSIFGATSQSSNLLQIFNNSLSHLFSVNSSGAIFASSTATSTFAGGLSASYLNLSGSSASSTFAGGLIINGGGLKVSTLTTGSCDLKADTSGNFYCGTDQTSTGQANPFTWDLNYNVISAATSSALWAQAGVFASSTSHFAALDIASALGVASGGTGSTTLTGILVGNTTSQVQTATISAPLSFSGSTLSITQSGLAADGYLSSADYTIFNNKISSSSLPQIFPFTPGTQYGLNTNSTTTLLQLTNGFTASSTSHLTDFDFRNATGTSLYTSASSTISGVLNAFGGANFGTASTTQLSASNNVWLTNTKNAALSTDSDGLIVASTTGIVTAGTGISLDNSTRQIFGGPLAITNSGVTSNVAGNGISVSGATGAVTITNTIGYPFLSNATTTTLAFNGGATFAGATTTSLSVSASSTIAGVLNAYGGANFDSITVSSCTGCSSASFAWTPTTFGSTAANATSTLIGFTAGIYSLASSTIGAGTQIGGLTISGGATTTGNLVVQGGATSTFSNGLSATYLNLTGSSASSTFSGGLIISGGGIKVSTLTSASCDLKSDTSGNFYCGTDSTSTGAQDPFTYGSNYAVITAATSSVLWAQAGVFASSTSHFASADFINATTTAFGVSGLATFATASTSNLTVSLLPATVLSTNSGGGAQATTISAPLSFSGSTLSITQSGLAADGYLSSADYTIFNNKISSSSLAQIFPFTPDLNYGAAANSTSTAIWFSAGLQASSTSNFVYASSTALTVSGNFYGASLSTCASASDKLLWTGGVFSCGSDAGAAGTDLNWTFFNGSGVRLATTSSQLIIGATATSSGVVPLAAFNVIGGAGIDNATTTNLAASGTFNAGSGGLVYLNSKVGIGTTSPTAKLTLSGGNFYQEASSSPTLAATVATAGNTYATAISGRYAYTAEDTIGLRIIDISTPKNPTVVGSYALGGAKTVAVAGKYAYVGDTSTGLNIIDISNPVAPTLVGTYSMAGTFGIALSGKYAFVSDFTAAAVRIIDVSNPAAPTLAGSVSVAGSKPYGLAVSGKYLYIADQWQSKIYIVDISNPASPAQLGTYTGTGGPSALYASGKYLYVADDGKGFYILDVSNPNATPAVVGSYNATTGSYYGVQVAGNYAYLSDHTGTTTVLDIHASTTPTLVGHLITGSTPWGITVSGKYAYVASHSSGLKIIDLNGAELPLASIGAIESNNINVSDDLTVGNNIYAGGGLNVGISGIFSRGTISAFIASTTQTNPTVANFMGGNVGIGTTTPYAALSVTGQSVFNYLTATGTTASTFTGATFTSATSSAFAVTGSSTITSVLNVGGQLNANLSAIIASTTLSGNTLLTNATTTSFNASGQVAFDTLTSALILTGSTGILAEYTGIDCTNQFVRDVSAAGAGTCETVGTADVSGLDISDDTNLAATWPVILTGDTLSFGGLSTTTAAVQGNIPYFSGVNTFANVATGTITGSTGLSVTAGQSIIGSGLTITNTGVTSLVAGSGVTISGATGAVTVNSTFPFTQQTQYGLNTSATTTLLQLTNGFTASSTSHLVDFDFRSATSTGSLSVSASTTIAGQFNAVGGATLGAATIGTLTLTNALAVLQGGTGVTSFTANQLLYGGAGGTAVASVATGTITGSTGLSVTAGQSIIGSGLTITNTGVTSNVAGNGISVSGATGAVTITNTIGFPYTSDLNFGALANSTTTALWLKAGLQASSTSQFDAGIFKQNLSVGSTSPFAYFAVHAASTTATTTLFTIGSTTSSGVNSTLFSVNNTGLTTLLNLSATSATTSALSVTASSTIGGVLNAVAGANFGTQTNTGLATLSGGFYSTASSTLSSSFFSTLNNYLASTTLSGSSLFTDATSTAFAITGISTGNILKTTTGGALIAAVSGTDYVTGAGLTSAFPFASDLNFGALANSTTTPVWFKSTLQASSTSQFDAANFWKGASVGSTSPFAYFAVHAASTTATTTLFAIGSTTSSGVNSTLFSINNTGLTTLLNLSATSATTSALSVTASSTIAGVLNVSGNAYLNGQVGIASTTPWARLSVDTSSLAAGVPSFAVGSSTRTDFVITQSGNVGLGTTSPFSLLSVNKAISSSDSQLTVAYNDTTYSQLQVDATGDIRSHTSGSDWYLVDDNFWICNSGSLSSVSCLTSIPTGTGNLVVENKLGIGTSTLGVAGANYKLAIETQDTTTAFLNIASSTSNWSSTTNLFTIGANGRVGIGSSTPFARLAIGANGAITTTENKPATSTPMTISWIDGNQQLVQIGYSAMTISFSDYIAGQILRLVVCNPGGTAGTITWGTSIEWQGATAPTQTTTANYCDLYTFIATQATSTTGAIKIFGAAATGFN